MPHAVSYTHLDVYKRQLVGLALVSLFFGAAAGVTCSYASCGFAKNLRHDLFYKIRCV